MIQRCGFVIIQMLANVQQQTIAPLIKASVMPDTLVYIGAVYMTWCKHKTVNHGSGEFARDEDGDGFCEVHVNTMEGFEGVHNYGHCREAGFDHIAGFLKKNLFFISAFLNLFTMSVNNVKPCFIRWSSDWLKQTLKHNKSLL